MNTLVVDVETDDLLPGMTRVWCMSVGDPKTFEVTTYADQPGFRPLAEGMDRIKTADRIIGHNFLGFDYWVINRLFPGTLRFHQIWDTLVVSRLMDPQRKFHSLEDWGVKLGYPKAEWSDFSRWDPDMAAYCARDVEVNIKIYRALQNALKKHLKTDTDWRESILLEHQVSFVLALQEQHGFRLDVRAAADLAGELHQEKFEVEQRLKERFGEAYVPKSKGDWSFSKRTWVKYEVITPKRRLKQKVEAPAATYYLEREKGVSFCPVDHQSFNPASRKQIAERLSMRYGWVPVKWTDAGSPELDESVIKDLTYPEATDLNRLFRLQKQLGQVADGKSAWLKLETGGRVYGRVNPNGARTGRMSHFAPNMAQVDKKDLRMRAVWLADVGCLLVGCDAEGLELRVLAHYLAKWDGGAYAVAVVDGRKEDETDAHNVTKRAVGLLQRDSAKTFIYAMIYGGGNKKLGIIIMIDSDASGWTEAKLAKAGKAARAAIETNITGLGHLTDLAKKAHRTKGWVRGLDGRRIYTNSEHSALNTLLQGGGAIVMKKALALYHFELAVQQGWVDPETFLPRENTITYCANVHDEVQQSCDPSIASDAGQTFADAIRLAGERLSMRCPLSGSFDVGASWAETH